MVVPIVTLRDVAKSTRTAGDYQLKMLSHTYSFPIIEWPLACSLPVDVLYKKWNVRVLCPSRRVSGIELDLPTLVCTMKKPRADIRNNTNDIRVQQWTRSDETTFFFSDVSIDRCPHIIVRHPRFTSAPLV